MLSIRCQTLCQNILRYHAVRYNLQSAAFGEKVYISIPVFIKEPAGFILIIKQYHLIQMCKFGRVEKRLFYKFCFAFVKNNKIMSPAGWISIVRITSENGGTVPFTVAKPNYSMHMFSSDLIICLGA